MGKTENDYIAEYVKERCPELLNTVDYSMWKLGKAASEFVQTIGDSIKAIDWSKADWSKAWIDEKENADDSSDMDNSDMRSNQSNTEHCSDSGAGEEQQESRECIQ